MKRDLEGGGKSGGIMKAKGSNWKITLKTGGKGETIRRL